MAADKLLFVLALLPTLLAVPRAQAALPVLPNVQASGTVLFNLGGRIDSASLGPIALSNPDWGTAFTDIEGQPSSAVSAGAQMTNVNFSALYARGVGSLGFFFAIDGPGASVPVLVDVAGSAAASASSGASFVVQSTWELWDSPGQLQLLAGDDIHTPQSTGSFSQSFGHTVSLSLATGHVYFVKMIANAEASATNPGSSASAQAFVDPVFRFGAGVDAALYTFGLSAGVGNQPVPEPPAAALLALGLLVLGWRRFGRA